MDDSRAQLPTPWKPLTFSPDLVPSLPVSTREDSLYRIVEHRLRGGYPELLLEVFEIDSGVVSIARCEGWRLSPPGEASQETMPLSLLEIERFALERIEAYTFDLSTPDLTGTLRLTGEAERDDLPVVAIASHLNGGSDGYAR